MKRIVIGIGTCGSIIVNMLIQSELELGLDYVAINSYSQILEQSLAPTKILITRDFTDSTAEITETLAGADLIIILAGMGGLTGTLGCLMVTEIAKNLGITTIGIVTKPFTCEGSQRMDQAETGINQISSLADLLVALPNDKICTGGSGIFESFQAGDKIITGILTDTLAYIDSKSVVTESVDTDMAGIDWHDLKNNLSLAYPGIVY
jgi:cell division protein FtsZ